jgi:hypothetical protein
MRARNSELVAMQAELRDAQAALARQSSELAASRAAAAESKLELGRIKTQLEATQASLASATAGYSGSEIEQAVIAGLYDAFDDETELLQHHLVRTIGETLPLSATMGEEISRLREWSRNRTRPASGR